MNIERDGDDSHDQSGTSGAGAHMQTPPPPPPVSAASSARRGRRIIPYALLGVLTVGAGVGAYVSVAEGNGPSAAVASAVTNSLRFKSAATTASIDITEPGGTATITAKGVTSFDSAIGSETVQIVSGGQQIDEKVISDGSAVFVHLNGGIIAKVVNGKSWISVPSGQSEASNVTGGGGAGGAATLQVLSANGNDVSDLGSSRVRGRSVHLYAVHLTRDQIQQDVAEEHLPQFMRQEIALVHIPAITYRLAINATNQLTQMQATVHLRTLGQKVSEQITEYYSHYGAKISVTPPPSSEVIPYQRFLQKALAKGVHVVV